ncbi:fumarylacetoacetate hydrolase domain-containing protein 2 [Nymphalis io]|uniref:fumarylacetoacetate hydrolase domain-containing protein 2 n=1 Tax=Inachis io TaxID=171585 RepID=UPI002169DD54|nr:fumarylacetoacetate hydrolase domain-containing protein 2 [Nymphalis io]
MNSTISIARRAITSIKTHCTVKRGFNIASDIGIRKFSVSSCRNMKFVQFVYNEKPNDIRVGYLDGDKVVDINKADSSLPSNLLDILKNGDIEKVNKLKSSNPSSVPLSSIQLAAPIHGNDKVLCVGLNYKDHCEEQNLTPPEVPMIFSKFSSTIIGQKDAVKLRTDVTNKVDWEVELTVVIGKKASNVKAANAFDYVFGYTVAQDISARDWQKTRNGGQFLLGKSMDTFCPIGPCITTSDEIGNPQNLSIKCSVNGVQKQSSNTNQLVHKIENVIERLSSVMTLLPGDIILTGTPGGVGMYRSPPEYLKPGDVVHSEIQNIGVLETRVEKF